MDEHAIELLHIAVWCIVAIGAGALSLVTWGGKKLLGRLDAQDSELKSIRVLLESEVKQLRDMQHAMDVRVVKIETACQMMHGSQVGRRSTDRGVPVADPK